MTTHTLYSLSLYLLYDGRVRTEKGSRLYAFY